MSDKKELDWDDLFKDSGEKHFFDFEKLFREFIQMKKSELFFYEKVQETFNELDKRKQLELLLDFTLSKNILAGLDLLSGIMTIAIPNKIAKNITWSIFLLSEALTTKLLGTKSTNGCKGPFFLVAVATSNFSWDLLEYFSTNFTLVSSLINFPGWIVFTKNKPTIIAITVVEI